MVEYLSALTVTPSFCFTGTAATGCAVVGFAIASANAFTADTLRTYDAAG